MPNQYIVRTWLLKHAHLSDESLTSTQISQAYARLFFACAGLAYMMIHAVDFTHYKVALLLVATLYFLANLLSIPMIRRTPLSAFRCIFYPALDIAVVCFSMLIDGGQSSGIFFLLLLIILANGFRFGNPMLLYTQALSLAGLLALVAVVQNDVDQSLLFWQIGALLAIPLYVYLIGQRVEKAMKGQMEAEKTAHNLLDKGPLPIFTFELDRDKTPRILYTNKATCKTFQRNKTELVGECTAMLTLPEDSQEMINFCRSTFTALQGHHADTSQNLYIRSRDQSGKVLKMLCTGTCMHWHDKRIGVCFMLDISDRETMQEELESVHRQGYMSTLVAGIVHDFRNVLTNMIGYAEVLQMSTADKSAQQQLEAIIAAGDRGAELITHLLKLSRNGETDALPAYTNGAHIMQPLENILGLARLQMPPHIQLSCQIEQPIHDVAISMIEIEQIIMNLINNSMQAMAEKGKIHVHIGNRPEHPLSRPNHPCMYIEVTDNGSGIDSADMDKVFKAFWTSKAARGGTGLGLTLVQRIIKRHQGSIEVESSPHRQTRFSIHLPPYIETDQGSASAVAPAPAAAKKTVKKAADSSATYRILLVDDAPDILKIHQAMLTRMQHTSLTAENGATALELYQQQAEQIDLIITDFRMPIMDGLELVEHIRASGSHVPILMITAFGEDKQLQQTSKYHVTLINKPVSMSRFQQAIAETMERD